MPVDTLSCTYRQQKSPVGRPKLLLSSCVDTQSIARGSAAGGRPLRQRQTTTHRTCSCCFNHLLSYLGRRSLPVPDLPRQGCSSLEPVLTRSNQRFSLWGRLRPDGGARSVIAVVPYVLTSRQQSKAVCYLSWASELSASECMCHAASTLKSSC